MTSSEDIVDAGNEDYRDNHLAKMFRDGFSFSGYERDGLFLNRGDKTFLNVSGVSGLDSPSDGRASVFADFDNDGDLDIFVTTIQDQAHLLYRNNVGAKPSSPESSGAKFLRIDLEGTQSGTDAFGTVVRVHTSNGVQTKLKSGGAGYLSQHDPRVLFGLGADEVARSVEVVWPSGRTQTFENIAAGTSWQLIEGGELVELDEARAPGTSVASVSLPDPWSAADRLLSDLKVKKGHVFPPIEVTGQDGEAHAIRDLLSKGRRTILNLWATWCIPCATEMPELEQRREEFRQAGVELIGLNIDTREKSKVASFLSEKGIQYPVYMGGDAIPEIYDTDQVFVPLTFLVDEEGRVVDAFGGWTADTRRRVERFIQQR